MSLSPSSIIQLQLEAYNRRDIVEFMALFADDASIYELGAQTPSVSGKEAIEARYQLLFEQSPSLHSMLINRLCLGKTVIDFEKIMGRNGQQGSVEMIVIYQVENQLIQRLDIVRPS
jgi:hypothetical protein